MTSAAATAHDALLPRPRDGIAPGATLALLVHLGLLAALTVSVDWRTHTPDVVSAELWSSVPQAAAPPAPPPAPAPPPTPAPAPTPAPPPPPARVETPRAPDITIEQERKRQEAERRKADEARQRQLAERQLAERKEAERKEADRRKAEAAKAEAAKTDAKKAEAERKKREAQEAQRLDEQRAAQLRRMMGQAGDSGRGSGAGNAAQDAGPSAGYAAKVAALIRRASVFTGSVNGNPAAEVEVTASASGTIIARRLVKSSGSPAWDDAVLQAIDKAGTLPRDVDGRVPAKIIIAFRPNEQ